MTLAGCLPEPALWPALTGEDVPPNVAAHLNCCPECAARVASLRDQQRLLRVVATRTAAADVHTSASSGFGQSGLTRTTMPDSVLLAGADEPAEPAHPRQDVPAAIGPYRILRRLRTGGQADVFLAEHPALEQRVAVKWAHTTCTECPLLADRLTGEARMLSEMRHPGLLRVYDIGIADQRPYLVLEYVEGCTLQDCIGRSRADRQAARLMARLARTLHAVHRYGVLHLDIQPANVLVDRQGAPRLIDFGAACRIRDGWARPTPEDCCGIPEYMPPEQLSGRATRLGTTADVYALGAVLYELLTGAPPQPEWIWGRGRPGNHDECARRRSPALMRFCERAMSPDPDHRPRTAIEFARALERYDALRSRPLWAVIVAIVICWSVIGGRLFQGRFPCGFQPASTHDRATAQQPAPSQTSPARLLEKCLRSAQDAGSTAILIVEHGSAMPVSISQRKPEAADNAGETVDAALSELLTLPGTNLLVVPVGESVRFDEFHAAAIRRLSVRLPSIPPQTAIRLSDRGVLAHTGGPVAAEPTDPAKWLAVQSTLSELTPGYVAVAYRTAGADHRAENGLAGAAKEESPSAWMEPPQCETPAGSLRNRIFVHERSPREPRSNSATPVAAAGNNTVADSMESSPQSGGCGRAPLRTTQAGAR